MSSQSSGNSSTGSSDSTFSQVHTSEDDGMPYDPSPESDHGIYSDEPDLTDVSGTSDSNGTPHEKASTIENY